MKKLPFGVWRDGSELTETLSLLGWENGVKPGTNISFNRRSDYSKDFVVAVNAGGNTTLEAQIFSTGGFNHTGVVIQTGSVVGIADPNNNFRMPIFVAENENGETKGFACSTFSGDDGVWSYCQEGDSVRKEYRVFLNTDSTKLSIMKAPDIYGGCMFKDLYIIGANPYSATGMIMAIDGKQYMQISAGQTGFAVEIQN